MAGKQRYTCEQVTQALIACNGLLYLAAERLGCTSETVINYMHRYATIRQAVLERRGKRVDVGEAALDKAVLAGESWAVQFLLRTQGKDRGYCDTTQHEHTGTVQLEIVEEIVVASHPGHAAANGAGAKNGTAAPGAGRLP